MPELTAPPSSDLLVLTAQIVSAHVAGNTVPAEALPDLIARVHGALAGAGVEPTPEPAPAQQQPAVPVRKSVQPDYLVCLEDGAQVTMLKRYLQRRFGLTPDEYRAKWGLPADYPMVAPSYAARRSTLAKEFGLGRRRRAPDGAAPDADELGSDEPATNEVVETVAEQLFPADMADEAKTGRHTAESVFANFGRGDAGTAEEGAEAEAPPPADAAPRKRDRKPFAEQSMRAARKGRAPAAG